MSKITKTETLAFLRENPVMSIAVSMDNKPMSSVLAFAIDDDFSMYFVTHGNSHKTTALLSNPYLSLCVWDHTTMLVQADGMVTKVADDDLSKVIDKLVKSHAKMGDFWPPVFRESGSGYVAFKIEPTWMRVLDLTDIKLLGEDLPFTDIKLE